MTALFIPDNCSEREAGGWEDCTWCVGVDLNNAAHGRMVVPTTRAEYEALRVAGGDGPAENSGDGSNNAQLVVGITRRYHWTPLRVGPPGILHPEWATIAGHVDRVGDVAGIQGSMGVWPRSSTWRRWDQQFSGPHNSFVVRRDSSARLWWMNPQAPNSYAGEWISMTEAQRFYEGFVGGAVLARVGQLVGVPPAPDTDIATLWGPDVPASIRKLDPGGTSVGFRINSWGHDYQGLIGMADLEEACRRAGIKFKTRVDALDVRALIKSRKGVHR